MKNLTYTMFALAVVASMTAGGAIAAAGGNGNGNGNAGGNGNKGAATQQTTTTQVSGTDAALLNCWNLINGVNGNGTGDSVVNGTDNDANDPKDVGGHVTNCDKYWQSTGEIGNGTPDGGLQDNF